MTLRLIGQVDERRLRRDSPEVEISCVAPTAANVERLGAQSPVDVTLVPPILGTSTPRTPTYEAVVLFAVASKPCTVAPTVGSHCARGTRASAATAASRDSALLSAG